MNITMRPILLVALLTMVGGCQPSSRPRPTAAAVTACRAEVDRVYQAQNRGDLSTREDNYAPFSGTYLSGVPSQGLGARYARDNMEENCLNNTAGPDVSPGTAPAANIGPQFSPTTK